MNRDTLLRERVAEELSKLPGSNKEIARRIDCDPTAVAGWKSGKYLPSLYHLVGMHEIGIDIFYIITGERTR